VLARRLLPKPHHRSLHEVVHDQRSYGDFRPYVQKDAQYSVAEARLASPAHLL